MSEEEKAQAWAERVTLEGLDLLAEVERLRALVAEIQRVVATESSYIGVLVDELVESFQSPSGSRLVEGLCGNREDHEPHVHVSASLGVFRCTADQSQRLPYAAERRRSS